MRVWRFADNGLKPSDGGGEDLGHGQGSAFLRWVGSWADAAGEAAVVEEKLGVHWRLDCTVY